MKILFLTPQLPYPPHQGTTLRNFNIIRELAVRHEIHLLSFGMPEELADSPLPTMCPRIEIVPPPARSMARRALETFLHPLPDMARRLHSTPMIRRFLEMMMEGHYDVVQVEGIEMANTAIADLRGWKIDPKYQAEIKTFDSPAFVFDDHNAEWTLQKSAWETDRQNPKRWHAAFYSRIQYAKLIQFERAMCLQANAIVAVSTEDAAAIASLDARIQPYIIPNGVDCNYYVPSEGVCAKPLAELSVVFTGKMDFRPNIDACVWFANEILPLLRQEIPLAHVSFVGQKPSPKVVALQGHKGVEVTGFVPDTRPFIADAAVFAVPLRMGSGTRLKVLEAMAMGKAIVSTSFGVSGIECENGKDVLIADKAAEFSAALAMLMRDPARARSLGENARNLAVEKYDWKRLVPQFEEIYRVIR